MPWDGTSWFGNGHDNDDRQVWANRPHRGARRKVKAARKAARRNRH